MSGPWPPPTPQRQPAPPPPTLPAMAPPRVEPPPLAPMAVETFGTVGTVGTVEDVTSAPKRRVRWAFVGTFALIAAMVCALIVVVAQPTSDSGADPDEGGEFSLAAAMEQASSASTVEFAAETAIDGVAMMTMHGGIDSAARTAEFDIEFDPGAFGWFEEEAAAEGPSRVRMVIDDRSGVGYVAADGLDWPIPGDPDWVSMTEAEMGDDWGDLFVGAELDPRVSLEALGDAASTTVVGVETIDALGGGQVETQHVVVTVDLRAAIEAGADEFVDSEIDGALADAMLEGFAEGGMVDYHLWVDADDVIRKMSYEMGMFGQTLRTTFDLSTSDRPLDHQVPPAGVIVAASDLPMD